MSHFDRQDLMYFMGAQGWLARGDPTKAGAALDEISASLQGHRIVLDLRWEICSARQDWSAALQVATALTRSAPQDAQTWLQRSKAFHGLERTTEARDNLQAIVEYFPADPLLRYWLAWYEVLLGNVERGREWLAEASKLPGGRKMLKLAHHDPVLHRVLGRKRRGA